MRSDDRRSRVLLLGSGLVAGPVVTYLAGCGYEISIASNDASRSRELSNRAVSGRVVSVDWSASDIPGLAALAGRHDVVVSLLPATFHAGVAEICLETRRDLITASYVTPEMKLLDARAREQGVILFNEIGLDPGIDHMSAMQVIDRLRASGDTLRSFRSYCGGLPAPEANDNPWGYKFSWSPLGVLRASTAPATFLSENQRIDRTPIDVFRCTDRLVFEELGELEAYANRDSLPYKELYRIDQATTVLRGTLRYPGWAAAIIALHQLDLLTTDPPKSAHWAELTSKRLNAIEAPQSSTKGLSSEAYRCFEWLGLFKQLELRPDQPLIEQLAERMSRMMYFAAGERDMVVMRHIFVSETQDGAQNEITSTLVVFGEPDNETAMARTVGLPVGLATDLLLRERDRFDVGVHIPIKPEIYEPIMKRLATFGISMVEEERQVDLT